MAVEAAPTDVADAVIESTALPRVSNPPPTVRLVRSLIPEVVATLAAAMEAPSTESAVASEVVVAIPLIRPSPEEAIVLLVPPIASLKVTAEVPVLALFTEEASACDAAVEVDWTVASAAELKFRLCRPAAEIVSVVVAVVTGGI